MRRQLLACGLLLTLLAGCSGQSPAPAPTTHVVTQTVTPTFTPTTVAASTPTTGTSTAAPTPLTSATSQPTPEPAPSSSADPLTPEPARVLNVYDGDTITVGIAGRSEPVRILGIDAPERENKNLGITGECYGEESGADLRAKLTGADVVLTVDPAQGDPQHNYRDKYDRLLRYVSALTNGATLDVGAYQLQAGNAWVYEEFPVRKTPDYMRIMAQAQAEHAGLWAACE